MSQPARRSPRPSSLEPEPTDARHEFARCGESSPTCRSKTFNDVATNLWIEYRVTDGVRFWRRLAGMLAILTAGLLAAVIAIFCFRRVTA